MATPFVPKYAKVLEDQPAQQPTQQPATRTATQPTSTSTQPTSTGWMPQQGRVLESATVTSRDSVLPTVSPSQDTSPQSWLQKHPWMMSAATKLPSMVAGTGIPALSMKGFLGSSTDVVQTAKDAAGLLSGSLKVPIQLGKGIAAESAGLMGNEAARTELLKPQTFPGIGEVKQISADEADVGASDTQTPFETALQAAEVAGTLAAKPGVAAAESGVVALEQRGAKKALGKLVEYISPKQTNTTKEAELLANKSGKMKAYADKGATRLAEAAKGLVDPAKRAEENIRRVGGAIEEEANRVRVALQADKKPFNTATFVSRLKKTPVPEIFKTDKTMENAYNLVIDTAKSVMAKAPKTREGAWEARKEFDAIARDQFGSDFLKSDARIGAPVKEAIKTVRRSWNDFIGEGLKGDAFKQGMKKLSALEDVAENIAEKNVDEVGMGTLEFFKKKHPAIYRTLQVSGAALGGGAILNTGKNFIRDALE